ncbi:MAG: hypothetical protein QNJ11_13905 [Woeseiaceae bacterium]|nr:hypothetical protein [Woeseiaceae bacterium]
MNKSNLLCSFLVSLLASMLIYGTSVASENQRPYLKDVDKFFELMDEGKPEEALLGVYLSSPFKGELEATMRNVAFQLANLNRTHGEYQSHEVLIHKVVAERFAYLMFFVAYDRQPFKVEFQFYRPDEEWFFHKFSFSDNIDDELVEAAKIKLLNDYP